MYREASSRRPMVTIALKPWPLDFPPPFLLETLETVPLGVRHALEVPPYPGNPVSRYCKRCLGPEPLRRHGHHPQGEVHQQVLEVARCSRYLLNRQIKK